MVIETQKNGESVLKITAKTIVGYLFLVGEVVYKKNVLKYKVEA